MRQLPIPKGINKTITTIDNFKGVDLTNAPANVASNRSPEAPNMIRDVPGKVRKRMGYYLDKSYAGVIYGVHHLGDTRLVHVGTNLYIGDTVVYADMNAVRSVAVQFESMLYILDGKTFLVYGEFDGTFQVKKVSDVAYIPEFYIAVPAEGGGTKLENLNLLQPKFIVYCYGDGTSTEFQLPLTDLDDDYIYIELLDSNGDWVETTDYTVNYTDGKITFTTAPDAPEVSGTDNIKVTAKKTSEGYADKINKCTIATLYGVKGNSNMLFLSGNSDFPNYEWNSEQNDATYFPDLSYNVVGQDSSAIVGYSLVNNYLAVHKSTGEDGRNVIMQYGEESTDDDGVTTYNFYTMNTIQGEGAIGKFNFTYLNESLFATKLGIFAITAQDITGEKYAQRRSFYLDGALADEDLENSYAIAFKDYYVLATANRVYILDSLQKTYEKNSPYSSFQYEGYYWEIPGINVLFKEDDTLCFGTSDGKIMKFYTDKDSQTSYTDNGVAISSRWDTPAIDGDVFFKKKNFRYLSVSLAPAIATGYEAYSLVKGIWSKLFDTGTKAQYFNFIYIDFSKINFSTDQTPRTIGHKIRIKRIDKVQFSFRNENNYEPFGIYAIGIEFTENGNFKG